MSGLLVAVGAWDVEVWVERFRRLMPERPVVALGEPVDPASVRWIAAWKVPPGALAPFTHARAIFSLGAGVDHLVGDPALPPVPVVRVVEQDLTDRMSEYVVLHCLAHLRQVPLYAARQRARLWEDDRHQPSAREVRVGVMGMGVLGGDAAGKLAALGFDVAGWSRTPREAPVPTFSGSEGLAAFLARTDILVCLLPLTPDTRGILGRGLIERLARDGRLGGPVLINAGRGGLQVEADLLACLDDGTLKAATLDVFETEPLPQDAALWTHPGVTVTPHNAAMSSPEAVGAGIVEGIRRAEGGLALLNVVDQRLGY